MADLEKVVAAIRERIDYERIYDDNIKGGLRGRGAERTAFCIFHANENTPALSINVEEGMYHCKNPDCGAKGDIFTFLMRVRSQTFPEVVRELARLVGVSHLIEEEPPQPPPSRGNLTLVSGDYEPPAEGMSLAELKALKRTSANGSHPEAPYAKDPSAPKKKPKEEKPPISPDITAKYHANLMASPSRLQFIMERRGWTEETIIKFGIGHDSARYTIPVYDSDGQLRNIRRYLPDAKESKFKMLSWREGYGMGRLFPIPMINEDQPIYVLEGELDTILARQLGLNAVSGTTGAETWREDWNEHFVGKRVVVCYDNDAAGHTGSRKVAMSLRDVAAEIKIVKIPLAEPKGADFTDYIHGHGHTIDDFLMLVSQTPVWFADGVDSPTDLPDPIEVHLSEASEAQYYNTPLLFPAMVSGKTTAPFIVPEEVKVGCSPEVRGTFDMCKRCAVNAANGPVTKKFDLGDNDILQMINVPQATLGRTVKYLSGVPSKCVVSSYDVLKAMNIEAVQLSPEIIFSDKDTPHVTRMAYYMGHGLQTNRSYLMKAVTVPEPSKQIVTHLIHTATPAQSNIDAFTLNADIVERLKQFQPTLPGVAGLWAHLDYIYEDLENVTKIYERRDLMLVTDLVYHSALSFRFQGDLLQRGWCEGLILGDSRTGKSTIVQRMMAHYRAGEMTSAENTTVAGLVAGLHQMGTAWILQWGRIPLNDRRLLAIDEASGLPTEGIGRMSAMRSSGIAEIIKVHTERTNARTRQIWISNARNDRAMASFSQGVLAVKDLIGAPADIARFDLITTVISSDVPLSVVNAPRDPSEPRTFTSELCHQRVMWAWSRKPDHILWADGATSAVLRIATEHGERYRYATEIPIVEPNEQRVKLARLAVATAMLFFSASDDGEHVIVKEEHVEFAAQFLGQLYAKPSLAFNDYADQQRRLYSITNPEKVRTILARNERAPQMLMEQTLIAQRDLMEILNYDDLKETRVAITTLRECSFIRKYSGTSNYVKTPAAIIMLRQMITGSKPVEQYAFHTESDEKPEW